MLSETMEWIAVEQDKPDTDVTVLLFAASADEPVWLGWYEGGDGVEWMWADGTPAEGVTHWAKMPGREE